MDPSVHDEPLADVPGADPGCTAAWQAYIRTLHAYRRLMSRSMSEHAVPPGQLSALREIGHDDGVTQRDLAERLRISRPTLTAQLQRMERAGFVERAADETDQRFTRLHLTPEGARMHEKMHDVIGDLVTQVMGSLTDADRAELVRILGVMYDNINTALNASPSGRQEAGR